MSAGADVSYSEMLGVTKHGDETGIEPASDIWQLVAERDGKILLTTYALFRPDGPGYV